MKLFPETDMPLMILGIIATFGAGAIVDLQNLRRVFSQRTNSMHELSPRELSQILQELREEGWITSGAHPWLTAEGRAYVKGELLRLDQQIARSGLKTGTSAIEKYRRLLVVLEMKLRVFQCEGVYYSGKSRQVYLMENLVS